ncbi:MAG: hypothetical protein PHI12_11115 [Dehalococcoidales bacterium]|nr:hypothetical protein [Dehalococcoidales bacterium]
MGKKKLDQLGFDKGDYVQIVEVTMDGHGPLFCLIKAEAQV